ncbi:MAG: hypothetical protein AB1610_06620 [Nitrospirota bacterium]
MNTQEENTTSFFISLKKDGEIVYSISVQKNITERKKAEEELEKYREHLEDLVKAQTAELKKQIKELEKNILSL